jgi:hypothetical protein
MECNERKNTELRNTSNNNNNNNNNNNKDNCNSYYIPFKRLVAKASI